MSRFWTSQTPRPVSKTKNDDSVQARPFKMNRFGHGATQTTPWSAIPKTRRHPDHPLLTDPNDTAPPTPCPGQQSPRHGAAAQQSPWHSDTHTRRPAAILMAQRHPRDTPSSNPNGTAAPRRHAQQQSPWHSAVRATRATRPTPIVTACHCVPRHSAAHAIRPTQPAAAFQETSAPSSHPQIHGFPAPATISQRPTRARTRDLSHRTTKSSDLSDRARFTAPATRIHRPVPSRAHQCIRIPHLPRETQVTARQVMRARNAPGTQSPRHSAATHPRHTSNTPDPRSLPRERDQNAHGATRARSQRTRRHSESVAPSRIPAQGHGFENLVAATPPP